MFTYKIKGTYIYTNSIFYKVCKKTTLNIESLRKGEILTFGMCVRQTHLSQGLAYSGDLTDAIRDISFHSKFQPCILFLIGILVLQT